MEIEPAFGCCGLLEIRDFSPNTTEESILATIKQWYIYEFEDCGNSEVPFAMFATTKDTQTEAIAALKALKFKATKFKSRHAVGNEKVLTHWFRTNPPTKLLPWLRSQKRKVYNDNW